MELVALLIYVGGFATIPVEWGFWKSIFWPYQLGKHFGQLAGQ